MNVALIVMAGRTEGYSGTPIASRMPSAISQERVQIQAAQVEPEPLEKFDVRVHVDGSRPEVFHQAHHEFARHMQLAPLHVIDHRGQVLHAGERTPRNRGRAGQN